MNYCQIQSGSYKEFGRQLSKRSIHDHIPLKGSIELTAKCNLKCQHCYIRGVSVCGTEESGEMNTKQVFDLLDQMASEGCLWLLLTGGEPLLRPDFSEIYLYAKKKGFLITLFTNGTLFSKEIAELLSEYPPFSVEISIYGSTAETYENVTGIPGSFSDCIKGINLLLKKKINLKLKYVVLTINEHELEETKKFAENLGLEFRFDAILNMKLDGDKTPSKFRLSPEKVVELDLKDKEREIELRDFLKKFEGPTPTPDKLFQCGAGSNTFHIDASGILSVCIMSRNPGYDLKSGTFSEGWNRFIPKVTGRKRQKPSKCQTCDLISLCGQCPGVAEMESGDMEEPVEYLCEIAHLRAEVLGKEKVVYNESNEKYENKKEI